MSRTAAARSVEIEPIDRLEEKIKMLVSLISRLKADLAERPRTTRGSHASSKPRAPGSPTRKKPCEVDALRRSASRFAAVSDMLQQLEGISLCKRFLRFVRFVGS